MRHSLKFAFVLVALAIVLMALANTLLENDVHEWRHAGECLDCHSKHNDHELKPGWTIPPPASHNDQFRRYTHGKVESASFQSCASCHRKTECQACHAMMPESHTTDFVKPRGLGMERHILLATIRPASCLSCHDSFVSQCVACHTAAEVGPWEEQAHSQAMDWGLEP